MFAMMGFFTHDTPGDTRLQGPLSRLFSVGLVFIAFGFVMGIPSVFAQTTVTYLAGTAGQVGAALGDDDAYETTTSGRAINNSSAIPLGDHTIAAFRFPTTGIRQGATILSAVLEFYCLSRNTASINVTYYGDISSGSGAPFPAKSAFLGVSSRAFSSAFVTSSPGPWALAAYNASPELKDIVQELVNHPDWIEGDSAGSSAAVIIVDGTTSPSSRTIAAWERPRAGTKSAKLTITYINPPDPDPPVQTLNLSIRASSDDAREAVSTGATYLRAKDVEIGKGFIAGFRFTDVTIPHGAIIVAARLGVQGANNAPRDLNIFNLRYSMQADDNPTTFTTATHDLSSRHTTATVVEDFSLPWTRAASARNYSANLAPIIQAIVDRPGWVSGNAMAVLVHDDMSDHHRRFKSWDADPSRAPILRIDFVVP
jgi:hypothetical protein